MFCLACSTNLVRIGPAGKSSDRKRRLTRQGLPPLISLWDMEVRSQEPEVRMAAAYAFSMRLTSSRVAFRPAVSP